MWLNKERGIRRTLQVSTPSACNFGRQVELYHLAPAPPAMKTARMYWLRRFSQHGNLLDIAISTKVICKPDYECGALLFVLHDM